MNNEISSTSGDIHFVGIDGWHRPIFVDKHRNFYGSTDKLFSRDATEHEVLNEVTKEDITFFGRKFGCEPMGTPPGDIRIVRKNPVEDKYTKCTLSNEELITKVKDIVSDLCNTGGRSWTLHVPVDFNRDPDVLISELCMRFTAQVEVMGVGRRCGTCEWWHHIEAGDGECYHDKNIEGRIYDGDDFMKIDICGSNFGCIHWKRKEG